MTGLFIPKLFAGTPLEKKIEGTVSSMKSVSKSALESFKERYYAPNNIVISAVGRFDEGALKQKVGSVFGCLDEKSIPKRSPAVRLSNRRRDYSESRKDITQTYMCLGYRVPGYHSGDVHALEMLSSLLSEGLSSRMYQELRDKRGIGYSVGSIYYPCGEEGMFIAHIEGFDPGRQKEAEEVILGIFRDLRGKPVPDREFKGTKTLMLSKYTDHLEQITERSMMLLETELYGIPYDFREKERHIRKIRKRDIQLAARKYLTDDYVLTALKPKGS